ncbi:MAG: hypothetical protein ACRBF0_21980 [Calditrichia bacterium]
MTKNELRENLTGGDRRSVGDATLVAEAILRHPDSAKTVVSFLWEDDAILRSRAAHALKTTTLNNPLIIQPFKKELIQKMSPIEQWEVREQFCIIITKLDLEKTEYKKLIAIFQNYLSDKSSIVRTCAMQGMADLAESSESIKTMVLPILIELTETGSAAMRARGRKLLNKLK